MFKRCFSAFGGLAVAAAALMFTAQSTWAQHGGHGGGGHGGGGHGGGGHGGGWHGGGGHGGGWGGGHGDGWRGGHRGYYGYGFGLGYPGYYGGYYPWSYGYSDYPWYDGGYNYSEPYYYPYVPDTGYYGTPSYRYAPDYGRGSYTYQAPLAPDNAAHMTVRVAPDAQVWFENEATTQQGAVRNFDSPEIDPGRDYTYDIRARWRQGDREVEQTRHVSVQAGTHVTVDFTAPAPDQRQTTPTASSGS